MQGLADKISRAPIYEAIKILLSNGVLIDERKNRRDHRLFINNENLLVTVVPQIQLFRTAFLDLVKSSSKAIRRLYDKFGPSNELKTFENRMMIIQPLEVLFYVIDMLMLTSTMLWPKKMKNREGVYPLLFFIRTRGGINLYLFGVNHNIINSVERN